jgi:pimeloyl-ACP methyl ester carboxylesterase
MSIWKRLSFAAGLALSMVAPQAIAAPIDQTGFADTKKTVELPNGITLAYAEMGNPEGEPLLLIHGFTDNARSWSLVAPHLAKRRLIAMDLRGHGKSEAPECCYALIDLAHDAKLLLDALKIEQADVAGHSLGSMAAQTLAARWPERVRKLVLVSSTASMAEASKRDGWLWEAIHGLQAPIDPNSQFMLDWYANPNPVDQDFITRERAESAAVPLQVWKGVLYETAAQEFGRMLPDVKAPVLVLWGDQDGFFGQADQDTLKAALPAAAFKAYPGLGHNMFWEKPEQVAADIEEFLEK